MKINAIIQKARIYVVAGTLSIMPTFVSTAAKKGAQHSAHYGIKAGEKLKRAKTDTYTGLVNKTKVRLGNGKTLTVSSLVRNANNIAASIKAPKKRPVPALDKNGRIKAFVQVYNPTKKGLLSGKTIMINSGHGGYNSKNGYFDPGAHAKDAKNKLIEEWYKNQNFAQLVVKELNAKGAKVIYTQGTAASVMNAKKSYKNINAFISIHCDILPKSDFGPTIIFKDNNDHNLASSLQNQFKEYFNCHSEYRRDVRNLGVLRVSRGKPSVLAETGNMANKNDIKNLDSENYRKTFAQSIAKGLIEFFGNY